MALLAGKAAENPGGGPGCGQGVLLDAWQLESVQLSAALRLVLDTEPAVICGGLLVRDFCV